jgi:hypothetical protein
MVPPLADVAAIAAIDSRRSEHRMESEFYLQARREWDERMVISVSENPTGR